MRPWESARPPTARGCRLALGRGTPSGVYVMTRILSVFLFALLLVACSDVQYSDSETSNLKDFQDDDKGGHPDEPIVE
jgi:hypothetical protein